MKELFTTIWFPFKPSNNYWWEMEDNASSSNKSTPMDISGDRESENDEIQWRFSQIKGNIESDESPSDGLSIG